MDDGLGEETLMAVYPDLPSLIQIFDIRFLATDGAYFTETWVCGSVRRGKTKVLSELVRIAAGSISNFLPTRSPALHRASRANFASEKERNPVPSISPAPRLDSGHFWPFLANRTLFGVWGDFSLFTLDWDLF